jgi:nanoRNase/pAp phosphatase (c-di-AMP/oligoRNAs hydrolase)
MEDAQQLAEKLKNANNVLVTVGRNPSVDGLSALLGLGLIINKEGKHSAAVFSGVVPSTIDFLKPEETLEKNTDSLRDFIIALDKSKADKLRYKVENDVVRIFITPYKTSISQDDLDFSQGDFNVDLVIALGVNKQEDLDEAITSHGRILHDATVVSINIKSDGQGDIGNINWAEPQASSLSEMVSELAQMMDPTLLDEQIATALLTGIVSETDRFSNEKTSSKTMEISSKLMAAGANQQLVATKLQEPVATPKSQETNNEQNQETGTGENKPKSNDGTLEIEHQTDAHETEGEDKADKKNDDHEPAPNLELPPIKEESESNEDKNDEKPNNLSSLSPGSKIMTEPPTLGGTLTANSSQEDMEPSTDPLSLPDVDPPKLFGDKPKVDLPELEELDETPSAPPPITPSPPPEFTLSPPTPQATSKLEDILLPPAPVVEPALSPLTSTALPPFTPPAPPVLPTAALPPTPALNTMTPPPSAWVTPTSPTPLSDNPLIPNESKSNTKPSDPKQLFIDEDGTLSQLEEAVDSPHLNNQSAQKKDVATAREEIDKALSSSTSTPPPAPITALNAQPLGPELHPSQSSPPPVPPQSPLSNPSFPPNQPSASDPPPVPPPIPFEFGKSS